MQAQEKNNKKREQLPKSDKITIFRSWPLVLTLVLWITRAAQPRSEMVPTRHGQDSKTQVSQMLRGPRGAFTFPRLVSLATLQGEHQLAHLVDGVH